MTAIVLASASAARLALLRGAGVDVEAEPAAIDESEIKQALRSEGADATAAALAELKALRISPRHPGRLVLGADQMLVCDGQWLDKPADGDAARRQLTQLRGKTHELISAAVAVRDGRRIWHGIDRARLTMRPFTDAFLTDYLGAVGDAALQSVGGYQLEGLGAQLFDRVDGDYFTILGLPLLPVLGYLRGAGLLAT